MNAWDNPEFREAVRATGKKQIIMAGIVTDVCEFIFSNEGGGVERTAD